MLTSQFCLDFTSLPPWWIRFAVAACVCFERERSSLFGNGLYSLCCPCCLMRASLSSPPSSLTSLLGKNYILFLNDQKLSSDPATPDGTVPGCVVCVLRRAGCLKVGEAWRRISAYLLFGVKILICISLCFAAICENLLFASKIKYNFKRIYKQLPNHVRPLSVHLATPFLKKCILWYYFFHLMSIFFFNDKLWLEKNLRI